MDLICKYINLKSAKDRKKYFEEQLIDKLFVFERINAFDTSEIKLLGIKGKLHDRGKAIFLSHFEAIKNSSKSRFDTWISEDDTLISKKCLHILKDLNVEKYNWDIIFTDVCFGDPSEILKLFHLNQVLKKQNKINIIPLKEKFFSSLNSYIINKSSVKKITKLIQKNNINLDENLDIFIARLVRSGEIKGFSFFPFISSVNDNADSDGTHCSSIQYLVNLVRKLFYFEDNLIRSKDLNILNRYFPSGDMDRNSQYMLRIQRAFLHPNMFSRLNNSNT